MEKDILNYSSTVMFRGTPYISLLVRLIKHQIVVFNFTQPLYRWIVRDICAYSLPTTAEKIFPTRLQNKKL